MYILFVLNLGSEIIWSACIYVVMAWQQNYVTQNRCSSEAV